MRRITEVKIVGWVKTDDLRVHLCIEKCVTGRLVNEQGMLRERMKAAQQG